MRLMIMIAAFLGAVLGAGSPALAQDDPRDCNGAGYLDRFEDAPTPLELACHVEFSVDVVSDGLRRHIRVISDDNAERRPDPAMLAALRRGVDGAADLLFRLTDRQIQDVSILLYDGTGIPDLHGSAVLARTLGDRGRPECNITFYGRAEYGGGDEIAVTAAHEIFHCMQYATFSAAQMNTYGGGGTWWVEGAAEALADQAVPGTGAVTDRSDDFAGAVAREVALNQMEHESTPFFQWLISKNGLQSVMDFQRAMSSRNTAAAQQAAMRAALSDADWMAFAKSYADDGIVAADGARLATPAPDVSMMDFNETQVWTVTRAPFVLNIGRVNYHCGQWANSITPAGFAALKVGGEWADWPPRIENFDETLTPMDFVALNTGSASGPHRLTATLETPCGACGEVTALDRCLVGRWLMTGGGPVEWMRAHGAGRVVRLEAGEMAIQILRSGHYVTGTVNALAEADSDGLLITGEGIGQGNGKWSAAGGVLNICQQSGGVEVNLRAGGHGMNMAFGPADEISMQYTCAGGTLTTTAQISPRLPPMVSIYTRQ